MTKPKRFLDSLREMVSPPLDRTCNTCHATYAGEVCPACGSTTGNGSASDSEDGSGAKSVYLVDLVSNHKIQITVPICKVGRDEGNDIVISGDQAISRQHLTIYKEGEQFFAEDAKSRHGTFINGNQLAGNAPINDGDVIKIGVSMFWFVAEDSETGEESTDSTASSEPSSSKPASVAVEPQRVSVKSEFFLEPTDPSTSTAHDIPVMANEEVLLDRLRLKTRSFDHADLLVQTQLQPGTLVPSSSIKSNLPGTPTQPQLSALDSILASTTNTPTSNTPVSFEPSIIQQSAVVTKSPEIQENVGETATAAVPIDDTAPLPTRAPVSAPAPASNRRSIHDYLSSLKTEQQQLQTQIEEAEKRKQEVDSEITSTKELINSLLGGTENVLMSACQNILSQLGWQCNVIGEDGQDLQLKADNQDLIVHVIWTAAMPDRSHLGKLFIAQTRFWCEQGLEPKGILIVSLLNEDNNDQKTRTTLDQDAKVELANFVKNKNVCLLTTANLLAIHHDIGMNHTDNTLIREKIMHTDGWLEGFDLEPLDKNN